ncbi:CS1 type fimbrial major subunit [Rheinheimera sp. KL1]|uniref:CS1 type fimbrial major subunit n=1 Tax=Rheinheimera sp. KL1 TaxID=1635005 RepID=UPI0006A9CEB0|nr:CS1 type fimbrial major subunit [Rheinheimera sp. KL1]
MRYVFMLMLMAYSLLVAAERFEHTVTVSLQLPDPDFQVSTPDSDPWLNQTQQMEWDSYKQLLLPIHKQLIIQSRLGAVSARLLAPALLSYGSEQIPLKVQLDRTVLSTTAQTILNAQQASAGQQLDMIIVAMPDPSGRYRAGTYQGVVNLLFETSTP